MAHGGAIEDEDVFGLQDDFPQRPWDLLSVSGDSQNSLKTEDQCPEMQAGASQQLGIWNENRRL